MSIERAQAFEQAHDNTVAAELFESLAKELNRPDLANQAAINWRLAKNYERAHAAFNEAYRQSLLSGDTSLADRVRRDKAMLLLEQEAFDDAATMLEASRQSQQVAGEKLEAAVTLGFIARVTLRQGDVHLAQSELRQVDNELRGQHDVYELNNLIWLLKVERPPRRLALMIRTIRLAGKTGYRHRAVEAGLITISPRLYGWVRSRA